MIYSCELKDSRLIKTKLIQDLNLCLVYFDIVFLNHVQFNSYLSTCISFSSHSLSFIDSYSYQDLFLLCQIHLRFLVSSQFLSIGYIICFYLLSLINKSISLAYKVVLTLGFQTQLSTFKRVGSVGFALFHSKVTLYE